MAERQENSVLFSLRELRNLEEDRVKQEEETEKARLAAAEKAKQEEMLRAKAAEEVKQREEADRTRREKDEREKAEREVQLRLQESEKRAQIEANTKLEQARIEAEAKARVQLKGKSNGLVWGVVALVVVGGIGGFWYLNDQHTKKLAAQQEEMDKRLAAEKREAEEKRAAEVRAYEDKMNALQAQLNKATNDAERKAISVQIEAHRGAQPAHKVAKNPTGPAKGEGEKKHNTKPAEPDDPLKGSGL